jgi:CRP/FNR family transcriptional regulator, cyclic AMP receptor protein
MHIAEFPEGAELCVEGNTGDAFFVVLDGEVVVRNGKRERARIGPGGFFGELALLDPAPRNATVVAMQPTTVGVLGARVFRGIVRDVPELTDKLLRAMARRLREADLAS